MCRELGLLGVLAALLPTLAFAGEVSGKVSLGVGGAHVRDLGPIVVYLSPRDGAAVPRQDRHAEIRQRNARFDPSFLVVTVGQPVSMPNDDVIFHNVFSFSRPNDFDLGMFPSGESRTVVFSQAGLVKLYCSIHESMSGAVLVTPSQWFVRASPSGRYAIPAVPAGRYDLTVWNEKLPASTQPITVGSQRLVADLVLGRLSGALATTTPGTGPTGDGSPPPAARQD